MSDQAAPQREPHFEFVDDVAASTAERMAQAIVEAVTERGRAVLCLSGGSTPVPVFRNLAQRQDLPWGSVLFAWGDERWVAHDHPDSNYGAAKELLLDHLPLTADQVMPFPYGDDPEAAAAAYAATLTTRLGTPSAQRPIFDLNLIGLGGDAHTASLFPATGAALRSDVAFALQVPEHGWRLTLSAPTLSASREVIFAVSSESKRQALAATWPRQWAAGGATLGAVDPALYQDRAIDEHPARAISAVERLTVITDVRPR